MTRICTYLLIVSFIGLSACGGSNDDSSGRFAFAQRSACSDNDKEAVIDLMAKSFILPHEFVRSVESDVSAHRDLLGCIEHLESKTFNRALGTAAENAELNQAYDEILAKHNLPSRGQMANGAAQNLYCAQEFSKVSNAITRVSDGEGTAALQSIYLEQIKAFQLVDMLSQLIGFRMDGFFSYGFRKDALGLCLMF